MSDPDLIAACIAGDALAWEALLERYGRLIYSIPLRYDFSESDAGDIFQTVSLLLLENLDSLRDRQRLAAWLVVTTRRECWRLMRQSRKEAGMAGPENEEDLESELAFLTLPHPEEDFLALERQALVHSAVDLLDSACKQLLTLLFYTEPRPPYADISRSLDLPVSSIGPTRARCLEKLMQNLGKIGFTD